MGARTRVAPRVREERVLAVAKAYAISKCDTAYKRVLAGVRSAAQTACAAPATTQGNRTAQVKALMGAEACYAALKLRPTRAPTTESASEGDTPAWWRGAIEF